MTLLPALLGGRPLVIGEIGQAHDGSLGTAHAFIDVIAATGAGAVKFQTHIASAESTLAEPWRVKFSPQDDARYDYWERMQFTEPQWAGLKRHADDAGVLFLSSPFSIEAVELLDRVGVPAWKVASGEITNRPMLETMVATGKPLLVSTGMSPWSELDEVVRWLRSVGAEFALFQCTSSYPCPAERIGLNVMTEMRDRYECPVGLSDHSATIFPGIAATQLGASLVEVHVTLSRDMFGPDVPASLTPTELTQLCDGIAFVADMREHPVDKDAVAKSMAPMRSLFTKSIVPTRLIAAGETVQRDDLTFKKPGSGVPVTRLDEVVGSIALRDLGPDELFTMADLRT